MTNDYKTDISKVINKQSYTEEELKNLKIDDLVYHILLTEGVYKNDPNKLYHLDVNNEVVPLIEKIKYCINEANNQKYAYNDDFTISQIEHNRDNIDGLHKLLQNHEDKNKILDAHSRNAIKGTGSTSGLSFFIRKGLSDKVFSGDSKEKINNLAEILVKHPVDIQELSKLCGVEIVEQKTIDETKEKKLEEVSKDMERLMEKAVGAGIGTNEFKAMLDSKMRHVRNKLNLTEKEFSR